MNSKIFSVAVLIMALSVAYYFVIFLPTSNKIEMLSINQTKCSQLGDQALNKYNQETIKLGSKPSVFAASSSHYNSKLGRCITEVTDLSNSGDETVSWVFIQDATEGRDLASCTLTKNYSTGETGSLCYTIGLNDGSDDTITKAAFDTLEKNYLTQ